MKKKGLVLAGLMALSLLVITAMPAYAQQATVSIGNVSLPPQASATLPIMITNESAQNVNSADITLTYDKNIVIVTNVDGSDFGSEPYFMFAIDNANGTVRMVAWSTTPLTTPIKFADVTVKAVGNPGDYSPLNLTINELSDENGIPIYPREVSNGSVSIIAAVPGYNVYGLSALIGLLAIIMGISIMAKVKRR